MRIAALLRAALLGASLGSGAAAGALAQQPSAQPGVLGTWLLQDHDGVVRIEPCNIPSARPALCGRLVGLTWNRATGHPPVDLHGRSQCNLFIMQGYTERRPGLWDGTITNPEDGKTYDAQISLDEAGRLRMRGYVLIPLLGQTQLWTRYAGPLLPDCGMGR